MILAWRNNPEVRGFMLTQHEITLEEHRQWFARVKIDKNQQQLIVMDGPVPLGFVQFNPISQDGIADWGFYTRPDAPKGSGNKLGEAALIYSFNILGLNKVCGQAIEINAASIAFHRKLGFTEEDRLPERQRIGGRYHKLVYFGLTAKKWQERIQRRGDPHATN